MVMARKSQVKEVEGKERLLGVRRVLKRKKPLFLRVDAHKRKRVKQVWRRPKGRQTKMREQRGGARKRVEPGFGSPRLVYGLSRAGYDVVTVHRPEDIAGIDTASQAALLSATLGLKKKVETVKAAMDRNVIILNLKDPAAFLKGIEERFAMKKAAKKEEQKKSASKKKAESIESVVEKEAKQKEAKPAHEEKAAAEAPGEAGLSEESPDDKAKREQKERDKVLTKKT